MMNENLYLYHLYTTKTFMDQAQFLVEYQIELILSLGTHNLGLHIEIVE